MKKIVFSLTVIVAFVTGCVPSFDEVGDLPDDPSILEVLIGNENGKIAQTNAIYPESYIDTIWVKDKSTDFSNVYLQGNLEAGCKIVPLDGATPFGKYGDFSSPKKYRVTAPTGNSADWTIVLDYYVPPVGCLADRWVGNLTCTDGIWADYSPTSCVGVKLANDCQQLKITFDFWGDAGAIAELELQLGDIDIETFTGTITLVNDVTVTSYGSTMTFHSGEAGTYNAIADELHLEIDFTGYDIGSDKYPFTIKKAN